MTGYLLSEFSTLEALPPEASALLDSTGDRQLFTSRAWYETFTGGGMAKDAQPAFFVLSNGNAVQAILPCQRLGAERGAGRPEMASLTSFYSCDFHPVIAPEADIPATSFALGQALRRQLSGFGALRLDTLDPQKPEVAALLDGLAGPGRALLRYAHFGGWWEDVAGQDFETYFLRRDGALREVVRRKGKKIAAAGGALELSAGGDVERDIAMYEAVYANSWKEPEPFPDFQPLLMRALARRGWLRLASVQIGGQPIAAQLWAVVGGRATVLKLAHDSTHDRLSPGTVLTAFAIRELIERDRVSVIDFGRGDDGYKRAWVANRTPHIGVIWASIRRRPLLVLRHRLMERVRAGGETPD